MRKLTTAEEEGLSDDDSSSSSSSSSSDCLSIISNNCSSPAGTLRMSARAVLTCRPNSHPFQERNLCLDQPVKIGRSVARARPNGSNAIFDCKVLSRNHALLWYETGKFFLQDTKSSNGTFVNNQRLSKSSEESPPREVCSGDIVQFGVDVMELNKKLTHGCIVANLQLFLPDGKEAKASPSTSTTEKAQSTSLQEIYQLNQFVKDAMQKEQLIENKLAAINNLVHATKESMAVSWKSLIEEDRLLTRIDILERQVQASHKSMTDDKLKEEIAQLYEDKEKYQSVAKEALRKAMQEKMDVVKKYQDLERNLNNSQSEVASLKKLYEDNVAELQTLAEKYGKTKEKSEELTREMDASSSKYKEEVENLNKQVKEGEDTLSDKQKVIDALVTKVDLNVARSILSSFNDDTKIILPENDTNKNSNPIINDNDPGADPEVIKRQKAFENFISKNELEVFKSQLVLVESERKEIHSRLILMMNLFEDLKVVSNKVQVSDYLAELIGKVDMEVHQIKNFLVGEDGLKSAYNYCITENINNDRKGDNHVNRLNSEEENSLEKLLEESRETIKKLQTESSAAKRQGDTYQEKFSNCAVDLEKYKAQVELLSGTNSELKSQVTYLQETLTHSDKNNEELKVKLESQVETIRNNEVLIETLRNEVSALKGLLGTREKNLCQISTKLNDLVVEAEPKVLEVACQTVKDILSAQKASLAEKPNPSSSGDSPATIPFDNSDFTLLKEKLLQTEEELAIFKDRYNESSVECLNLNRRITELQTDHDALADQSKLIQLRFLIIPIAILVLAILIAFHPSS